MRTFIISLVELVSMERKEFRCEAETFAEAIDKAEKAHPGFFAVLRPSVAGGQRNASVNS